MRERKIIEKLHIQSISAEGKSVGRKDGKVVFVKGGAPGDIADVQITGRQKKFLEGVVHHLHESSPDRTEPFCQHFGLCGGCKWQHLSYEAQLKYKHQHVEENFKKLVNAPLPPIDNILGSAQTTLYRNKLEFTFSNNRWLTQEEIQSGEKMSRDGLGFHIPKMFDKILNIDECHLQQTPSNAIRIALKDYAVREGLAFYNLKTHEGFLRNLIIRIASTGDIMVIVQFARDSREEIFATMNFLKDEFPEITSLNYVVNEKKNDTFFDLPVRNFHGQEYINEKMEELTFRIGPKSFYQTNSSQAYELYKIARDFADLSGEEVVYDLYTGTGTIACFVAGQAKKVIGVESVADAVEDAKKNAGINGITNAEFYAGDMKDIFNDDFIRQHGRPQVVITDPPRAGMHKKVIKALNKLRAKKIVYVSCNPATQARDLEELSEVYDIKKLQPVDMFPQTHHVECVALLELR